RLARFAARRPCRRSYSVQREQVHIIEVGPRDGLQNEKNVIPVATKIELVERLAQTGLRTIEAGSFVSPKWTPQARLTMANSSEILKHILSTPPQAEDNITYQWLVPNSKGLDAYLTTLNASNTTHSPSSTSTSPQDSNAAPSNPDPPSPLPNHEISLFTAATDSFALKNTNCTVAESLQRFEPIFATAKDNNIPVRAYISVALGCPYEGPDVSPKAVADLAVTLLEMGASQISVADTTGMGTAPRTRELLRSLSAAGVEPQDLALHFHDTYGQALVNTVVGLEAGIRAFDSAVSGLGGCPYSPGATGNVATEELVYLFESLGLRTGVDLMKLANVGEWVSAELGRLNESRVGKASLARQR
ncbi:aldolase, partial [Trichodelitschia bisporula]